MLAGCGSSAPADRTVTSPSKTVRAADKAITDVAATDTFLAITADLPENGNDTVDQVAEIASEIGQSIKSGAKDVGSKVAKISIFYRVPEKDRLGNDEHTKLLTLYYDVPDLKRANYKGLSAYGILDLSTSTEIRPAMADKSVVPFCGSYREQVPLFCGRTDEQMQLPN